MNWFKSTLANVAGTQEPIYGPSAIRSVAVQAEENSHTELTKDDLRWRAYQHTNVETQTFYVMGDNGTLAMVQVIYSNVAGIHTTAQFNSKIFSGNGDGQHRWHSDPLQNYMFDESMLSFAADNFSLTLNEDATVYTIKSAVNADSLVNLTFTRTAPGFVVGQDGTSFFGTDPAKPWGSMRHAFWPRCSVEGTITTQDGTFDMAGRGLFIHALQGMKPHHAAASWNFVNFQGPNHSAVMMEFTTPPSYGSTVVNVGAIARDGEILCASARNAATHTEFAIDDKVGWPEPKAVKFEWVGKDKSDQDVVGIVDSPLGTRLDRVDVMAEVPGFIKSIAGSVAGTRPYIYQFSPRDKTALKLKTGDLEVIEEGFMFSEATFISGARPKPSS